jgi:hypothetical protein
MQLRRLFFTTLSFFLILWSFTAYAVTKAEQIQDLDYQIEQLEDKKRGFEGRALKHEDQAQYLQFNNQALLEQRRHIQIAEENRAKAAAVQKQIDLLTVRRQKLTK